VEQADVQGPRPHSLFYDVDANLTNVLITRIEDLADDFTRAFRLQHDLKNAKD